MSSKISKILTGITSVIIAAVTVTTTAPAATAAPWPTHVQVVTNKATFDRGQTPYYEIKIHATDGPGRSLHGRASLWVNGNPQRIRDLEWGWRGFRIDRGDLPNNRNAKVQVRINPRGNDHKTVVVTRWVKDVKTTPGQKVLKVAKNQLGDRYVYGAAGPRSFDCSGLVTYSYRHATGKRLPHSSSAIRAKGHRVSNPRPGDVVWTPGHVSIYAGHGKVVEAAKPGTRVRLIERWQRNPVYLRF